MQYHYLIAGLPDIQLDEAKDVPTMETLKADLENALSAEDLDLLHLIYAKFDNQNLLSYIRNKDAELNPLGLFTSEDWKDLTMFGETELPTENRPFPYMYQFYEQYKDDNASFGGISADDYLSGLYYEYAMQNNNKFLHDWFEFNLNINNLLTAIACRKHGFDTQQFVIGDNETAQLLRKSSAHDFGLKSVFDQVDAVMRIAEETNLLTREKQIDELKWNWLEENTFFNYFTIERILSFVLRCELVNRWKPLTQEKGTQVFREMLSELKEGVSFEE